MSFQPIQDTDGKEVDLQDLVTAASTEIMLERKREATSLIKSFLMKIEGLDREIKTLKNQLSTKEESLKKTQEKIQRLRDGDWKVLSDNNATTKVDSESK